MSGQARRIVLVGAGLAGAQTAQRLRADGYTGRLTLIGDESHEPYDRPPLSKAVLTGNLDSTRLGHNWEGLEVELLLGHAATAVRGEERVVETTRGDVAFDGLGIATGSAAIRLPGHGEQMALRTIDDALALRRRLVPGARLSVVGASWIGAEVATVALKMGCHVTCIEAGPAPLAQALGVDIGLETVPWWDGVDLRLGIGVKDVVDGGLILADGCHVQADIVLVGVGARPVTAFLEGSGIVCDRGVLTDEWLCTSMPGIVAVGDVARFQSRRFGMRLGAEHWDNALRGAAVAAASLQHGDFVAGTNSPIYDPVPYFWSDQWGHKIQYVGHHGSGDSRFLRRSANADGWSVAWFAEDGRLSALLAVDQPRAVVQAHRAIEHGMIVDPAKLCDPGIAVKDAVT